MRNVALTYELICRSTNHLYKLITMYYSKSMSNTISSYYYYELIPLLYIYMKLRIKVDLSRTFVLRYQADKWGKVFIQKNKVKHLADWSPGEGSVGRARHFVCRDIAHKRALSRRAAPLFSRNSTSRSLVMSSLILPY